MIKVECEVKVYEPEKGPLPTITLQGHWNDGSRVVLKVGDQTVTVLAKDLHAAIANCTNTARF